MAIRWKLFEKMGGKNSRYRKYLDRVVVISTDKGFVFTPATMKLLGNSGKILLLHDGNGNMGIRAIKENDPEYDNAFTIQNSREKQSSKNEPTNTACSFVNCKGYLDRYGVQLKVVFNTISVENDIMVVDLEKYEVLRVQN